jgi:hypothetical protein
METINIIIISAVVVFILLLFIIIFFLRRRLKKKRMMYNVPENVLKDFNKAEEMFSEHKGEISPQEVLFKLWKEKNNNVVQPVIQTQQQVEEITQPKQKKIKLNKLFKKR